MLFSWGKAARIWLERVKSALEKRAYERIPQSWTGKKLKPVYVRVEKRHRARKSE